MQNSDTLHVRGLLSPRGIKYIEVQLGGASGLVPKRLLNEASDCKAALAEQDVILGPYWTEFSRQAVQVRDLLPAPIVDRVGWNGDLFVLRTREVASPPGAGQPLLAIETAGVEAALGSGSAWKTLVARPLTGQSLPMTLIMAALSSPLLELILRRDNIMLALLGEPGTGKSDMLEIVHSVAGGGRVSSFNSTVDGLEAAMMAHNGHPLILDELNLFYGDASAAARGGKQKLIAFRMADGTIKRRWSGPEPEHSHFVLLTATNEHVQGLIAGEAGDVKRAVTDRLLTLQTDRGTFGTIDEVPEGYVNAGEFVTAVRQAASANAGHAFRRFVRGLVGDLAEDREATIGRIQANMTHWCDRVGVDTSNGSYRRVGEAFGLFYAAGEEAKRHGVLPRRWRCGSAVQSVYERYYVGPKPPVPIDDAVRAVLALPGVRDIDRQGTRRIGDRRFEATPAFTKRARNRHREVWLTPANTTRHLPDLPARITTSRAGIRMLREGGHQTVKRQVRTGQPPDRMVVLELPAGFE